MKRNWIRIDVNIADDPRIIDAGPAAAFLYIAAIAYCSRNNTDGTIPEKALLRLISARNSSLTRQLLATGLLVEVTSSCTTEYYIPHYLEWQESAANREDRKARDRARKATNSARNPTGIQTESARIPNVDTEKEIKNPPTPLSQGGVCEVEIDTAGLVPSTTTLVAPNTIAVVRADDLEVFDAWREATGHTRAKFDGARQRKLRARRREGFDQTQLLAAARGVAHDPWPDRKKHDEFAIVFRDAAHVEKFAALATPTPTDTPRVDPTRIDELIAEAAKPTQNRWRLAAQPTE